MIRRKPMYIAIAKYHLLVKTPYSEKYDLVQKFRGIDLTHGTFNDPVDFMEAGLIRRDKWDCFHLDIPFAISNDEAVPCIINDTWIGAGHGHPCCVALYAPRHDKTIADVGSVWKDDAGVTFTLLHVATEDHLVFVSENIGTLCDYKFVMQISGKLTYVSDGANTAPIPAGEEQSTVYLTRAYKFTKKRVIIIKDGKERILYGSAECDSARIEEEYELRNPATVAPALTAARPSGGFTDQPDLGDFGETMLIHRMRYHILPDGTVLCDFEHEKTMDIRFDRWLGAMYQEKLDVFGGAIHRRIPKTLPLTLSDGTFDFNTPVSLEKGIYPESDPLITKEFWATPASPPDRVVDYFRDKEGHDRLGFACGYLPLYDGVPEKRLKHLTHTGYFKNTRKVYPTFMNGDLSSVRGIAYKKYFKQNADRASFYSITFEGKTYVYADFIEERALEIPACGRVTLYEKSEDVSYEVKNNTIFVKGANGYAVFICDVR
ncbi:MAG: hypothetical protein E7408_04395 [Ruminococcaceae bacterium]|nr:hypothetical protein [Oscillospiraceae bacterium]